MSDFMTQLQGSFMMLANLDVQQFLLKGTLFTVGISVITILFSVVLGAILALVRNYCTQGPARLLRRIAIIYIELFRNTPLMLWVFAGFVLCPAPEFSKAMATALGFSSVVALKTLFKAIVSLTLFTSAVMAEIIRGGLNAVPKGQFEAAYSQGFGTVRTMERIVLPQAFRHIVPTMLSQMITTIKDSSYMASLVTVELMGCTKLLISKANNYNGTWVDRFDRGTIHVTDVFVLFGAAFLIYFVINFCLSCAVRTIKRRSEKGKAA
ncbi:MAG: amino acid ABC transporter permease [Clostridia bacterium]|nr:amino acid ABC transporter permease [Clostridia bacterium]